MTWRTRRTVVVIVVVLFFIALVWVARPRGPHVAAHSVLVMDAGGSIPEQRPMGLFDSLGGRTPALHDYLEAIDAAAADDRITGIVVRISPLETGWAKLEELRDHLIAFQKSRKPSICYFGYDVEGNPEYYVATGCEQIWLTPTNAVYLRGLMAETLFLRGTLDKLKIVPDFYHIAEYKTASNELTEKKYTPAHREEVSAIVNDVYGRYVAEAADARHMPRYSFEDALKSGPLLATDAVKLHIVDRLAYWDQVEDYFRDHGQGWNPVSAQDYQAARVHWGHGPEIAVLEATGLIASGESDPSGTVMGGDSVASQLRRLRDDNNVRAIVLRIDSGGGSAVASEVIGREVERAREKKPVVVSMSDLAASGGYWIAAPATKIVAEPNTETASIGVIMGKLNLAGLYHLLGLSTDSVATSENASLFSDQQDFTPAQRQFVQKFLRDTYADFTQHVANERHLPLAQVEKIAKGRVWTGAQAKQLGLVDELGGLDRAIQIAKQLAHIPASESVNLVRYPREKTLFELLFQRQEPPLSDTDASTMAALARHLLDEQARAPVQARIPYELRIR